MKFIKTYKYKLKLTKTQEKICDSWLHTCRYLHNVALEERITAYRMQKKSISKYDQYNQLPQIKKDFPFIGEVYSDTLQEVLDRVDKAYKQFFKGAGFPKFAKKDCYNSFTFKRHFEIYGSHIKLPKIGKVKYFNSRSINGLPKTATIKKDSSGYFITITVETNVPEITIDNSNPVGVDVGIVKFATLSDGSTIESQLFLQPKLKQLKLLQRKLSRQQKGSKSREKTKQQIAKLYRKITNSRLDFLHKTSTNLANKYSVIYIEDLNLQKMTKTANSEITRKMSDSGFGALKERLKYKMKERGKHLGLVNPAYTSQTCNECGTVDKKSRISQSEFVCTSCGFLSNADLLASKNILREGISQSTKAQTLV